MTDRLRPRPRRRGAFGAVFVALLAAAACSTDGEPGEVEIVVDTGGNLVPMSIREALTPAASTIVALVDVVRLRDVLETEIAEVAPIRMTPIEVVVAQSQELSQKTQELIILLVRGGRADDGIHVLEGAPSVLDFGVGTRMLVVVTASVTSDVDHAYRVLAAFPVIDNVVHNPLDPSDTLPLAEAEAIAWP